jgi:glycosyltransferase involved in cell wall biosynthesis
MKIVIASTYTPFRRGSELTLAQDLAAAFSARKYQVDTVLIPFEARGPNVVEETLAIRSLDLTEASGNKIDLLITLRTPAYAIPHPNKIAWFSQHHQDPVEAGGLSCTALSQQPEAARTHRLLARSDACYLAEAKRIYANSKTVAKRLKERNGINVQGVLYPPLLGPQNLHSGDCGDYFLYVSRLHPCKRQELAIEAMKSTSLSRRSMPASQL